MEATGFAGENDELLLCGPRKHRLVGVECWLVGLSLKSSETAQEFDCRQSLHSSDSTALTVSCGPTSIFSCMSYPALIDHDDMLSPVCLFSVVTLCCMAAAVRVRRCRLASWQEIFLGL